MSRIKHLTLLIFKLVFIVACFALASITTVLQTYSTPLLTAIKNPIGVEGYVLEPEVSSLLDSEASLAYQIVDGAIVFDLAQSGERYNDVAVLITLPAFSYDDSAMREYLNQELGKDVEKEEKYLSAMAEGPWKTTYSFTLTGNTEENSSSLYTVGDPDSTDHTQAVQPTEGAIATEIENLFVEKNESLSFFLVFGSKNGGALPSGKYTFTATLTVNGLWKENAPRLSFGATTKILANTCLNALKQNGFRIFSVENWLSFYGVMVVFGMFIYLWRDLRCMAKIFGAVMDSGGEMVRVIVSTYVNGVCVDSHTEFRGGPSLLLAILVSVICFIFFIFTIPLRMAIFIVRDIVYLCKEEDEVLEGFSYTGNILGSVGVYVLLFGAIGLLSQNFLVGGIAAAIGIIMCIVASKLCKKKEEEYG